jgi:predicted 2-oxoglutarate/Fe(II)-dependent dioxygenase YbiX
MKVEEAIMVLQSFVNKKFCNMVMKYINKKNLEALVTADGNDSYRKVIGHILTNTNVGDKIYFQLIHNEIKKFYINYKVKFPQLDSYTLNQIDLLKYSGGGHYGFHVDTYDMAYRNLSIIINLNDGYKGGDLIFGDQKRNEVKRISLKQGSVVIFPSNFLYPHKIEPVTEGERYSIVAWLE